MAPPRLGRSGSSFSVARISDFIVARHRLVSDRTDGGFAGGAWVVSRYAIFALGV